MSSSSYFHRSQEHPRRVDPFVHYVPREQKKKPASAKPKIKAKVTAATAAASSLTVAAAIPKTTATLSRATALKKRLNMDESNIVAIPRHPPLPHNVSGMFQGAEPPYTSAQASKSSTISRDSSTSAALETSAIPTPANALRGAQLFASNTESHSRSTYRPRASTGFSFNQPTDYSAAQHVLTNMPLISALSHTRRQSIDSCISDTRISSGAERKYTCDWHDCGQAFDRVEHLNRHKRRHTGEKPYRCLVSKCTKLTSESTASKGQRPSRCNGRGRTSLGHGLAECCILPTKNPDFSNLTLRPLINDMLPDTNSEETPLWETVGLSSADPSLSQAAKRFRRDSVTHAESSVNNYHNTSPLSGSSEALSSPEGKRTRLSAASPLYTDDGMARTTNINGYYYPQQHQHRHKPTHTVFTSSIQRPSLSNSTTIITRKTLTCHPWCLLDL
ncbi:hypothetical protein BX661DRAFT_183860 [Kickxella alabastrina]|uniref:uncharacterized protein n=1 Tax=Kickxella alabastrina TaxID=61397 RepID=UPI00221FE236|nr:uncharacterized protein BX661DRAFT_183860 [Kickxella alabastrina]KAI7826364.1 hypothetical protein BX661DRAFT_183860 [Kickxella alabastrina]